MESRQIEEIAKRRSDYNPIHRPTASVISLSSDSETAPKRFIKRSSAKDLTWLQSTELTFDRLLLLVGCKVMKKDIWS
jgi:hypothetical protein